MPPEILTPDQQTAANAAMLAGADPVVTPAVTLAVDPAVTPAVDPAAPVVDPIVQKPTEGTGGDKPGDGAADPASTEVPETYAEFTVPEGMEVNKDALEAFLPVAKDLKLTQDQAQKLVNLQTAHETAMAEQQITAWENVQTEWREATKVDQEIGGTNLQKTMSDSARFLGKFATPELRDLLDRTGVGNNVEFIRLFAAAGNAMGEDNLVSGRSVSAPRKTQAEILYSGTTPAS